MKTGMWIWKIKDCNGGDPLMIAQAAKLAGLSRVYLKVADGPYTFNINPTTKADLCPAVVKALQAAGIEVWGWHYCYGYYPDQEAQVAVKRISELHLDGYILDVEGEFKTTFAADAANRATTLCTLIRKSFPTYPLGFSSFRFPNYHQEFVWSVFYKYCDFNLPQVYWEQAHNAGYQVKESLRQFKLMSPKPLWPIGATYKNGGWAPSEAEVTEFLDTCKAMGFENPSFFSWDECERDLPALWAVVSKYGEQKAPLPPPASTDVPTTPDRITTIEQKVAALQTAVTALNQAVTSLKNTIQK
jgi:hypothetical protein